MSPNRSSLLLCTLMMVASFGSASAQRRDRLPPPRDPQFYAPRNKLEEFEGRVDAVLFKGQTWVGNLRVQNGSARVEAIEIRDTRDSTRATGVVITINSTEPSSSPPEIRVLIDYEEIDPLVAAFDTIAKAGDSITRLAHFEARYRTHGDFEIMSFKEVAGGAIAASVEGGFYERKRLYLNLEELVKLRWMIAQAKEKLDEIK
ncbi:MAG: hypothetical protein ACMG6H_10720 [Acidobacteriota bacterium]